MNWKLWRAEPVLLFGLAIIAVQAWAYFHAWPAEKTTTVIGFLVTAGTLITRQGVVTPSTLHEAGMTLPQVKAMAADPAVLSVEQKRGLGNGQRKV